MFSQLASWSIVSPMLLDIRGVAGLKLGFSFPIRNLVTKCDLRCLVVWWFPNPIWRLDWGSVPAITALPILVGLTRPGLHWKLLDAAIGQVPAPYCPGGRHGQQIRMKHTKH